MEEPVYDVYESLTISNTAVALTASVYKRRKHAFITVESAAVRFRFDDTAPTATVGHLLEAGDVLTLGNYRQVVGARFIRKDGTDATLRVSYGT